MGKTLILIDGHALAYRQYFALERTGMRTNDGTPTWAVYGFFKAVFDLLKNETLNADAVAVAFDVSKKTFRTEIFEDYKSTRKEMPDALREQLGLLVEGLEAFSIPIYTKDNYEADDVIGTIAKKACALGHKTLILTGDQDAFQLVDKDGCTKVIIPSKGELIEYDWNKVHEKLGVYPDQVVDYKALRGDTSDFIPGIKGIGEKTAVMLLDRYYTLDKLLADCENIPEKAVRERVCNGREDAKQSKVLATIVTDVDVDFDFEKTHIELPDLAKASGFLKKMQFHSFLKNINSIMSRFNRGVNDGANAGAAGAAATAAAVKSDGGQLGLFMQEQKMDYKEVTDVGALAGQEFIAFKVDGETAAAAFNNNVLTTTVGTLKDILENDKIKKTTHDVKSQYNILRKHGITLRGVVFDTVLASYIKDPSRRHDLDIQAMDAVDCFVNNTADEAAAILKLTDYWQKNLEPAELKLLDEVELPLSKVLADMEYVGVCVDKEYLKELTALMDKTLCVLEKKIYDAAGEAFNINSPKQVGEILFEKLGLKSKKRRGKQSTSAGVLEELAHEYEIADLILQYRKFAKLKSTYTQALPELIDPADGRIHTSYNQTVTTTGRLSSSNPNLQNIPIRTEEGSKIRQAFVPQDRENFILSADYSQIELRLLAHVSGDKNLQEAFLSGVDIHTLTAAKVFEVAVSEVTKEMRYRAKAVNFGIIYGQSKYGLAKALGISHDDAQLFIGKYFKTYPGVKTYMENTVKHAEQTGFVETIFGRKRYLADELGSANAMVREFAKRAAINQPMQGTAADLIKMAMIDFAGKIKGLKSKMIMQVHDEIVVELDRTERDVVQKLIKESMELGQPLSVPLVVDISVGESWKEG